jgi:hypothetical protein
MSVVTSRSFRLSFARGGRAGPWLGPLRGAKLRQVFDICARIEALASITNASNGHQVAGVGELAHALRGAVQDPRRFLRGHKVKRRVGCGRGHAITIASDLPNDGSSLAS